MQFLCKSSRILRSVNFSDKPLRLEFIQIGMFQNEAELKVLRETMGVLEQYLEVRIFAEN